MKILNIRFRKTKKVYPFVVQDDDQYSKGDIVIVETIRGDQITVISKSNVTKFEDEGSEDVKIREVKRKLNSDEIESLKLLDKKALETIFYLQENC